MRRAKASRGRVVVAVCAALAYAVASLGLLPSSSWVSWTSWFVAANVAQSQGERYPCEDHACGCVSAHECWTNCCCHTMHERLVWALQNKVTPPKDLEITDADWVAAADDVDASVEHCSACVPGIKAKLAAGDAAGEDGNDDARVRGARPARAWSALGCKGLTPLAAAGVTLGLGQSMAELLPPTPSVVFGGIPRVDRVASRVLDVTPPPPRV